MALEDVPRCQHIKINGTQCGSPALRRRRHCFFHDRIRREQAKIAANTPVSQTFQLPLLEDANSVQVALMKVIQMLASGRMDHKTAGLILYALQTASVNLRLASFEVGNVRKVVIDRDTVNATCIGGPQWFANDFGEPDPEEAELDSEAEEETEEYDDEENDEIELEDEDDQDEETDVESEPEVATEPSPEDVRKQVSGVIRDWASEAKGRKPQ
jgi:hypothetical protein